MLALLFAEDRVIESAFLHSLYVDLISGLRRHRAAAAAPATRGADAGDGDGGDADDGGAAPRQQRRAEAAALTNASLTTLGDKIERCVERTTLLATPRARAAGPASCFVSVEAAPLTRDTTCRAAMGGSDALSDRGPRGVDDAL